MREKFELCCKVLGLVFFCIGIYYSLSSVPLYFQKAPDVTRLLPQSALGGLSTSQIAEMNASFSYMWRYAVKQLVLLGIVPILMGWYLMRSNNLFVNYCYPGTTPTTSKQEADPPQLTVVEEAIPEQPEPKGDERFAPPEYHQ